MNYTLTINKGSHINKREFKYGNQRGVLCFNKQGCTISFFSKTIYHPEDIVVGKLGLLSEGIVKCHLLHSLYYGKSLNIKTIAFESETEKRVFCAKTDADFPFIHSTLNFKNDAVRAILPVFENGVLETTKRKREDERKYVCLYSLLDALSQDYEYDRFSKLWTCVNSMYTHLAVCAYPRSEWYGKKNGNPYPENATISFFAYFLGHSMKKEQGDATAEAFGQHRSHSCSKFIAANDSLSFDEMIERIGTEPDSFDHENIKTIMKMLEVDAWSFLNLAYPYWLRCNLLHGSKTFPIFASKSDDIYKTLKFVNKALINLIIDNIHVLDIEEKDITQNQKKKYLKIKEGKQ